MESILCAQGYCIQIQDIDYVMGNTRYFCDMFPKRKKINIYKQSICKWADSHNISYEYAKNIILAHEYFHSIESEKNGWVSKQYLVPMLIIGKLRIGKTGITALSEVAANAFAYEYYCHCEELKSDLNSEDKTEN